MIEITYYFHVADNKPHNLYRSESDIGKGLCMYRWESDGAVWRRVDSSHPIFKWFYNGDLNYEMTTEEVAQKYFPQAFN